MVSVAELVLLITGKDEASKTVDGLKGTLSGLEKPALVAGAAISGLGVGVEALAKSQQDSNVVVKQNAAALGISEGAYRDLALSISSAGLPLEDVNGLFKTAREEGLTSGEDLKKFAQFWDDVGDATGASATALAEGATGLRAVGIAAGEEGKALNAFGFITDHTKLGIDDFLGVLAKKGADIKKFGLNIDDTAAILGQMEKELGLTGRAASAEFVSAMDKSDGTLQGLLSTLGLSQEGFTTLRTQVDASSGVIERNAALQDSTITSMDRWKNKIHEFAFEHAGLIKGLSDFAPIMTAVGPSTAIAAGAVRTFGAVTKLAAASQWGLNAAMLANPIVLVVAAIVAIVAILVVLEMKFGLVSAAVDLANQAFGNLVTTVIGGLGSALTWARDHWPIIATIISGPFAPLVALATDAFGVRSALVGAFTTAWNTISTFGSNVINLFTSLPGTLAGAFGNGWDFLWTAFKSAVNMMIRGWNRLSFSMPGVDTHIPGVGKIGGFTINTPDIPLLAQGGIVTRPTLAMLGEAGPEAVIPLNRGGAGAGLALNFYGPVTLGGGGGRDQIASVGFAVAAHMRSRGLRV